MIDYLVEFTVLAGMILLVIGYIVIDTRMRAKKLERIFRDMQDRSNKDGDT